MIPAVEEVLNELDGHRVQFAVLSRWLTAEQLERPVPQSTWIVKDFISHLATIDGPVSELFRTTHEGGDPGIRTADGARLDVDSWNERQVQQRRSLTVDEILEEAARERSLLRAHLARLTEADLASTMKFQGDGKRPAAEFPLGAYLKGWCKHDVIHASDMLRAMPERMTPILERWLDDPVVRRYQAMMNSAQP
ncbi:MAG: maleylpyruvate isomerase N-terminal domain-containing protein [Tepidiformaceae bacterium]